MYYQPTGRPHIPTKDLYRFQDPKRRHHKMTVAYTQGGPVLADAYLGLVGYVWQAYVDEQNQIIVKREDLDELHVITTKQNITQLDLTIDQNMRPFLTYVADGLPYYFHFNAEDSTYSEVALDPSIKFPRCELDMRENHNIPNSDIILGYTREGNLCYRIQRERYGKEYIIATDQKKTMLWRIGRLVDDRFGYQWR